MEKRKEHFKKQLETIHHIAIVFRRYHARNKFIKYLQAVFIQFSKNNRLNPTHISLYIALFQVWNKNRFPVEFYFIRDEVMSFSKIGSKTTYHRCIRDLSNWTLYGLECFL